MPGAPGGDHLSFRSEKGFAGNAGHMLGGHLGRLLLQAGYFVLAARALGASDFGLLMAVHALVAVIAPLASLGAVTLLIRHVVRDPARGATWFATCITAVTVLGTGTCVAVAAVIWAVPVFIPATLFLLVAVSELVGARLVEAGAAFHQAHGRMSITARMGLTLQLVRLLVLAALVLSGMAVTTISWAAVYALVSLAYGVVAAVATSSGAGFCRPDLRQWRTDLRDGGLFAVGSASQTIYNDVDKVMLGAMIGPTVVGTYSAGYRFVDMSFAPVRAVLGAAQPWFFREGQRGTGPVLRLARLLAWPSLAYGVLAAVALVLLAPLAPVLLGPTFADTTLAVRLLAVLVVLKTLHYVAADALTGAGRQALRSTAQVLVALLNVALNLVLIPWLSWRGAVLASIVCDLTLAATLWFVLIKRGKQGSARSVLPAVEVMTPAT